MNFKRIKIVIPLLIIVFTCSGGTVPPNNVSGFFLQKSIGGDPAFVTVVTPGTARNNFAGTVGFSFTVSGTKTVTFLGSYVVVGSTQTHRVAIWSGPSAKVVEATFNKSILPPGYNKIAVSATLTAGTYYCGEEEFSGGDSFLNDDGTITGNASIGTITGSTFQSGSYDAPQSSSQTGVFGFGVPNIYAH